VIEILAGLRGQVLDFTPAQHQVDL